MKGKRHQKGLSFVSLLARNASATERTKIIGVKTISNVVYVKMTIASSFYA
jgi:hypothetical protein